MIASRLLLNSILRAGFVACALLPLLASAAGCRVVVEDEKGRKKLDTDSVDQLKETGRELRQAGRELRQAGRQLRQVGRQVGEAGRQAGKAVSPVAKKLFGDAGITARVKARLIEDPEVRGLDIDVHTVNGEVTLSGQVETRELRAEAVKLARRTEGVVSVVDRLEVTGEHR